MVFSQPMTMSRGRLAIFAGSLILGALAGLAGALAGPIALAVGAVVAVLLLAVQRTPGRALGPYLMGAGAAGSVIYLRVMIGSHPCGSGEANCYAAVTTPTAVVHGALLLVGLLLTIKAAGAGGNQDHDRATPLA